MIQLLAASLKHVLTSALTTAANLQWYVERVLGDVYFVGVAQAAGQAEPAVGGCGRAADLLSREYQHAVGDRCEHSNVHISHRVCIQQIML